jgi:hypothetical protein
MYMPYVFDKDKQKVLVSPTSRQEKNYLLGFELHNN